MTDIISILERYRVPLDTSGRGKNRPGWANTRCFRCGKTPYLGIHLSKLYSFCWNCGYIPISETVAELTGMSRTEAYALVGGLPRADKVRKPKHSGVLKLPEAGPLLPCHEQYLQSRGFDAKTLSRVWGLRGIGMLGGRLAWRILIPVHRDGEVVSWTTRKIVPGEPRYVSASDNESAVPITDCLYGVDHARHGVVVVEGPADAWRCGVGAVALLGLRVSPSQLRRLAEFPVRAVCFDSGPKELQAQERARRLVRDLSVFPGVTVNVRLESGNDPASAHPDEIKELRRRYLE